MDLNPGFSGNWINEWNYGLNANYAPDMGLVALK